MRAHAVAGTWAGRRAHPGRRQRRRRSRSGWCARRGAWPSAAARRVDRGLRRDRRASRAGREAERERVGRALRLAEQLGGEAVTIPGERRRGGAACATRASATSPRSSSASRCRSWWRDAASRGSLVDEVIRRSGDIDVRVDHAASRRRGPRRRAARAGDRRRAPVRRLRLAASRSSPRRGVAQASCSSLPLDDPAHGLPRRRCCSPPSSAGSDRRSSPRS